MKLKRILVMNGPNLNMLGTREPQIYGNDTLEVLNEQVKSYGRERGVKVSCFQANGEGKLIKKIHRAPEKYDAIVFNPGAYTHYSYALRDALASIDLPTVEVHLSNVDAREPFRARSVVAPACVAQIKGRGFKGYCDAIDLLLSASAFDRLGEGYETRCAPGEVVVAPLPQSGDAEGDGEESGESEDAETEDDEDGDGEGGRANVEDGPDHVAGDRAQSRLARLRERCAELGYAGFYARDTSNIAWLFGFDGVFDEERAHALLVTPYYAWLHTDSRYENALRDAAAAAGSPIEIDASRGSHAAFAHTRFSCQSACELAFEDDMSVSEYLKLDEEFAATPVRLQATSQVMMGLRAVKDQDEIARMKAAQAITDEAFSHIVSFMRPGMTERAVQIELEDFMIRHGAHGLAFSSIVATGANGANPHAIPGETVLQEGQCVVIDFGAKLAGYCSDMTRTVFLGEPTDEMRRAWAVLVRANETVEGLIAPGVTGADMHECAERVLAEGGFAGAMGHGLGHGVGMQVHELPLLSPRYDKPLVEGNVVTVEPGIYIPGKFGMRLEDFGVVTHEGYERFTQSTHDMVIIKRL